MVESATAANLLKENVFRHLLLELHGGLHLLKGLGFRVLIDHPKP